MKGTTTKDLEENMRHYVFELRIEKKFLSKTQSNVYTKIKNLFISNIT